MKLEMFIFFDGNCREAVEFYAKAFQSPVENLMTYAEAPPQPDAPVADADKDLVMYAGIPFGGMVLMFMDMPTGYPLTKGDQISPTISSPSKDEITELFHALKDGGEVLEDLHSTFYSEWYGMVRDRFGVVWQILHYGG